MGHLRRLHDRKSKALAAHLLRFPTRTNYFTLKPAMKSYFFASKKVERGIKDMLKSTFDWKINDAVFAIGHYGRFVIEELDERKRTAKVRLISAPHWSMEVPQSTLVTAEA